MINLKHNGFNVAIEEKMGMDNADLVFTISCDKLPDFESRHFSTNDIKDFEQTMNWIIQVIAVESLLLKN